MWRIGIFFKESRKRIASVIERIPRKVQVIINLMLIPLLLLLFYIVIHSPTATPEQAEEMCAFIRNSLIDMYDEDTADEVIIQYGGSVKPANATEIMNMDEIDGALVGGASLKAADFMEIIDF